MNSKCEICDAMSLEKNILTCCWKAVCPNHTFTHCEICNGDAKKISYLVNFCERCEKNEVMVECQNCSVFYCKECSHEIHSKGKFKMHSLKAVTLAPRFNCSKHSAPFLFFCEKCDLLCQFCQCKHDKIKVEEFLDKNSNDFLHKFEKICEKLQNNKKILQVTTNKYQKFLKMVENIREKINFEFLLLKSKIDEKKAEIEEKLHKLTIENSQIFEKFSLKLESLIGKLDLISNIFSFSKKNSILLYHLIKSSIPSLEKMEIENKSIPIFDFDLKVEFPNFSQFFESFSLNQSSIIDTQIIHKPSNSIFTNSFSDSESKSSKIPRSTSSSAIRKDLLPKKSENFQLQDLPPRPASIFSRNSMPGSSKNTGKTEKNTPRSPGVSKIFNDLEFAGPERLLSKRKFIKILKSSNAIKLSWISSNVTKESLKYILEWSLDGIKFESAYTGRLKTCIITDLIPDTFYFFKVAAILDGNIGEFSDIISVKTEKNQLIDKRSTTNCNFINDFIEIKNQALIYTSFAYTFGKNMWKVVISANEKNSGFLKIGVTNSEKKNVTGKSVSLEKLELSFSVFLDIEAGILRFSDENNIEDIINIPKNSESFPAIQFKSNKNAQESIRVKFIFGLSVN